MSVLLMLTMGLIQYGYLVNGISTLTYLTRQGARYAAIHITEDRVKVVDNGVVSQLTPDAAVRWYIRKKAAASSIANPAVSLPDSAISITPASGTALRSSGRSITVSITYDLRRRLFLPANFPGLSRIARPYTVGVTHVIE